MSMWPASWLPPLAWIYKSSGRRSLPWPPIFRAAALARFLTTDLKEYRIDETRFAVGYMETVHRRRVDEIRDQLVDEMKIIRAESGFAALLFMVVDIVHSQTEILIVGMEQQIAETFGQNLVSPNSITIVGIMSRKKQVIPVLPRVARQWKSRASHRPGRPGRSAEQRKERTRFSWIRKRRKEPGAC